MFWINATVIFQIFLTKIIQFIPVCCYKL